VLSGAQVALGTPATARGWPVPAPAGSVLEGPGGGPVVLSGRLGNDQIALVAFRGTGARRWVAASSPNCGNCEGSGEVRLNADGTYGPIGFTADRFWAVSQAGALVEGCPGVPLADGTCVAPASNAASVRASRAGATLWEYVEPGFTCRPSSTSSRGSCAMPPASSTCSSGPDATGRAGPESPAWSTRRRGCSP
jgi:hypothetical protein